MVDGINKSIKTIWNNQVALSKSQHSTDAELSILLRLTITQLNAQASAINRVAAVVSTMRVMQHASPAAA